MNLRIQKIGLDQNQSRYIYNQLTRKENKQNRAAAEAGEITQLTPIKICSVRTSKLLMNLIHKQVV